jgi:hypothetical protein
MKFARPIALVLLLATAACSEQSTDQPCPALIGGGSYCLQPTTAVPPFDVQQKVESRFRDRRDTLIVELEVDAAGLRFAGLTPFGQKLIQLSYDNRSASATTIPDSRISPALLVALLQLAQWPAEAVRAGLEKPLTLEENGNQRRILNRGEPTLTIDYGPGQPPWRKIHMIIHAADLELTIETLDAAPAAAKNQ